MAQSRPARSRVNQSQFDAVESVWLHHKLHQTFNKINVDMTALLAHNLDALVNKWGVEKLAALGIEFQEVPATAPVPLARLWVKFATRLGSREALSIAGSVRSKIRSRSAPRLPA